MKKYAINFIYIITGSLHFSCNEPEPCMRTSSNIVSEIRDVKDFHGVIFTNIGDLFLTQGPEYSFRMEGPENVVEFTTTAVENEILVIGNSACFNNSDYELTVEITAPEFTWVNFAGIGSIQTVGSIEGDILVIEQIGLGEIEADVYVDSLYTNLSGQSDITYVGKVIKHELMCAGEFTLDGDLLETDQTFMNITGIGDSYVYANDSLYVTLTGSGNVYYKGNPSVQTEILGTGEVIDNN